MKVNKGFSNLSAKECLGIFPEIIKNGEEYFRTAKLLAENGYYGKAIAFQILGAEEYVKAMCLCLEGYGFGLRKVKELKGLFKHHQPRHSVLRDTYSIWIVVKHIYAIKRTSTREGILRQLFTAAYNVFPAISNHEWWMDADHLKQRGFYVDYLDEILAPSSLVASDFEVAVRRTKPVAADVLELTEELKKMKLSELKQFKKLFKEAEVCELLTETINREII